MVGIGRGGPVGRGACRTAEAVGGIPRPLVLTPPLAAPERIGGAALDDSSIQTWRRLSIKSWSAAAAVSAIVSNRFGIGTGTKEGCRSPSSLSVADLESVVFQVESVPDPGGFGGVGAFCRGKNGSSSSNNCEARLGSCGGGGGRPPAVGREAMVVEDVVLGSVVGADRLGLPRNEARSVCNTEDDGGPDVAVLGGADSVVYDGIPKISTGAGAAFGIAWLDLGPIIPELRSLGKGLTE